MTAPADGAAAGATEAGVDVEVEVHVGFVAVNAPMAARAAKAVATSSALWPAEDAFTLQRRYTDPVRESADAREGAAAFVEGVPRSGAMLDVSRVLATAV